MPVSNSEWGLIGQTSGFPDELPGHGLARAPTWGLLGVYGTHAPTKSLGPTDWAPIEHARAELDFVRSI